MAGRYARCFDDCTDTQVLRSVEEWTSQKIVFWLYRRVVINICNSYLWSSKPIRNRMKMWKSSHKRILIGLWMLFLQWSFFRGLSNAELVHRICVGVHAYRGALPSVNFRIFAKTQFCQRHQHFRHDAALQKPISAQKLNSLPLLHSANSPIPITLASSLPNALPCFHTGFTRRTIGHCLGTFTAVNFSDPP